MGYSKVFVRADSEKKPLTSNWPIAVGAGHQSGSLRPVENDSANASNRDEDFNNYLY